MLQILKKFLEAQTSIKTPSVKYSSQAASVLKVYRPSKKIYWELKEETNKPR